MDAALTDLDVTDPVAAQDAEAAFGALTWGQGLQTVSLRGVQEFLWYQLPSKFAVPLPRNTARSPAAWARCSTGSDCPATRGCAPARSPSPCWTLTHTGGRTAGITAYRKALHGGGVEPPDIPGLSPGAGCSASRNTPRSGRWPTTSRTPSPPAHTPPARRGWRDTARGIARGYLTVAQAGTRRGQPPGPDPHRTPRPVGRLPRPGPGRDLTEAVRRCSPRTHRCPATPRTTSPRSAGSCSAFAGDGAAADREQHPGPGPAHRGLPPVQLADPGQTGATGEPAPRSAPAPRASSTQLGATRRRGRRLLLTTRGQRPPARRHPHPVGRGGRHPDPHRPRAGRRRRNHPACCCSPTNPRPTAPPSSPTSSPAKDGAPATAARSPPTAPAG